MSFDHFKGAGWAAKELMRAAQADIDAGTRPGATVIYKRPDPVKTSIGKFAARLLRFQDQGRAKSARR